MEPMEPLWEARGKPKTPKGYPRAAQDTPRESPERPKGRSMGSGEGARASQSASKKAPKGSKSECGLPCKVSTPPGREHQNA